ncbi:MAG: hypothetical protein GX230_11295 [Lentisphaerae bacterium]|jgi:hypothetical protein|nr:hypothetical protein [Lentisphaerota bacterium]
MNTLHDRFLPGLIATASAVLTLCGCSPAQKEELPETKPAAPTTSQQALEGFTGKTAVDAGLRAKKQIEAIDTMRRQQMSDAE